MVPFSKRRRTSREDGQSQNAEGLKHACQACWCRSWHKDRPPKKQVRQMVWFFFCVLDDTVRGPSLLVIKWFHCVHITSFFDTCVSRRTHISVTHVLHLQRSVSCERPHGPQQQHAVTAQRSRTSSIAEQDNVSALTAQGHQLTQWVGDPQHWLAAQQQQHQQSVRREEWDVRRRSTWENHPSILGNSLHLGGLWRGTGQVTGRSRRGVLCPRSLCGSLLRREVTSLAP